MRNKYTRRSLYSFVFHFLVHHLIDLYKINYFVSCLIVGSLVGWLRNEIVTTIITQDKSFLK